MAETWAHESPHPRPACLLSRGFCPVSWGLVTTSHPVFSVRIQTCVLSEGMGDVWAHVCNPKLGKLRQKVPQV